MFRPLIEETLFALLPAGHRLAARQTIQPEDVSAETFISFSASYCPTLRRVIDDYFARAGIGIGIAPARTAETLPTVISLALSTGGVTLLPAYMAPLLPPSMVDRSLAGSAPKIPLALGYSRTNPSALLQRFLSRTDALVPT